MAEGEGSAARQFANGDGLSETKASNYIYFVRPRKNNIRVRIFTCLFLSIFDRISVFTFEIWLFEETLGLRFF